MDPEWQIDRQKVQSAGDGNVRVNEYLCSKLQGIKAA
jgi:hypothetical protein